MVWMIRCRFSLARKATVQCWHVKWCEPIVARIVNLFVLLSAILMGTSSVACERTTFATTAEPAPLYAANDRSSETILASLKQPTPCADTAWAVLPDPWHLASLMAMDGDLQILDIRRNREHAAGMLPLTTPVSFENWRDPARLGLPKSDEGLSALLGSNGLRLSRPIVIVAQSNDTQELARAAYVHWILTSLGADEVAILNGGMKAWQGAGLPTYKEAAALERYEAKVRFGHTHLAGDYEVYGIAMMQMDGLLVDVRSSEVVNRFDILGRALPTTLPGALNAPITDLARAVTQAQSRDIGFEKVRSHMASLQTNAGPTVSFSSTGELAALNWFLASQIGGLKDVRVYPEGIKGWRNRDGALFRAANVYDMVATD